jgi:Flp pilus assembly protein TadG
MVGVERLKLRSERGQATVEFALILPIVLLLVVGMIEFAKGFNYWLNLNHLANEGARWAAVNKLPQYQDCTPPGNTVIAKQFPTSDEIKHFLVCQATTSEEENAITGAGGSFTVCVQPSGVNSTAVTGDPITVKIKAPYSFPLTSGFVKFFNKGANVGGVTLAGSSTQRLEYPNPVGQSGQAWITCS